MPVSAAPTSTPSTGLVKARNSSLNQGASASGAVASLIRFMPAMRMAKPRKIWPTPFCLSLPAMNRMMPAKPSSGAQASGLSIWIRKLSPSRPVRLSSQAVTVVPMLAPMMTPTVWYRSISPELTKPTTMTVVAELDWITAVTARPSSRPRSGEEVILLRITCRRPPAVCSRFLPMTSMPYKNMARPPSSTKMLKILILGPSILLFCFL